MYRVRFPAISIQKSGESSVAVAVAIEEGAQFTLGSVQILGDDLPRDAMERAANLKTGPIANWGQIQQGVWEMERPVRRLGYFSAQSKTARVLHDDTRVLAVNVSFEKGALYHFGQVTFLGLSPAQEAQARKTWNAAPGSPYDFLYPNDFLRDFSRLVDFRQFKKYEPKTQPAPGDHVMDVTIAFEPR
jgi:outer membrane protein assembly factor BamA